MRSLRCGRSLPGASATPLEKLHLLARYGAHDPETALTYIDTLPAAERAAAAATVKGEWTARDPEAAVHWMRRRAASV